MRNEIRTSRLSPQSRQPFAGIIWSYQMCVTMS
jgi:hypothetical protein